MGIDHTGMGGNGIVKSHSRLSLMQSVVGYQAARHSEC